MGEVVGVVVVVAITEIRLIGHWVDISVNFRMSEGIIRTYPSFFVLSVAQLGPPVCAALALPQLFVDVPVVLPELGGNWVVAGAGVAQLALEDAVEDCFSRLDVEFRLCSALVLREDVDARLRDVAQVLVLSWSGSNGLRGIEAPGAGLAVAEIGELGDGLERRLALHLRIEVRPRPWVFVLRVDGHRLVDHCSLLPERVLGRLGLCRLVVVVLRGCGEGQLFLRYIAIKGHFLT